MYSRRRIAVLGLAFLGFTAVTGCATSGSGAGADVVVHTSEATAKAREKMIGKWFGTKTHDDGSVQQWLANRAADGTYLIQFRVIERDGTVDEWAEAGVWGVRLPIYFTAMRGFVSQQGFRHADTSDPVFYDAYRIVEQTDDTFIYQSYTSGNVFTLNRVDQDFEFPDPPSQT